MKVKEITVRKLKTLPNYNHISLQLTVELDENDSVKTAYKKAIKTIDTLLTKTTKAEIEELEDFEDVPF